MDKANGDLTKAQQDAKTAQDKLTTEQKTAQGKQQAAQSAKEAMDQAKAKLDALKNGNTNDSDPIAQQAPAKVPAGFAEGMAGYVLGGTNTQGNIDYARKALTDNGFDPDAVNSIGNIGITIGKDGKYEYIFHYKDNFKDDNQKDQDTEVNFDGDKLELTTEQKQEVTSFVANIVNRIRQNIQSQPNGKKYSLGFLKVSPYATQLGEKIVDSAYNHGWNKAIETAKTGSPHNLNGLKEAANQAGVNTQFVGENMSSGLLFRLNDANKRNSLSMAEIKESLYITIMSMMYSDNNGGKPGFGGHTTAFLNDPQEGNNNFNYITKDPKVNQYLAVSFNDNDGSIHFNFISDANATSEVKAKLAQGATTPGVDQQSSASQDDIKSAQDEYNQKKTASDKAEHDAQDASETVENDQAEVKTASDAVTTAQQKLDSAKKKAQTAQEAVTTKQREVTDAQAKANATQGQVNEKKAALDAAGKSKDDQAKELNQAKADLQTAQQTLAADQKDQKTKQQAAQNVQSALKKAQETLTAKKSALDNAKKELLSAQDQLNQLEGNKLKNSLAMQLFAQSYAKFAAAIPGEISNLSARVEKLQKKLSNDQAALKDSQKVLATKKTELDAANAALVKTTSDTTIADLKAQLQKDQQQLAQDQATLAKYQQAVKDDLAAFARLQPETTGSQTTDQTIGETGENGSEKVTTQGQKVAGTTTVYRPTNGVAATVAFPVATANSSIAHQQAPSVVISHKAQSRLPQTGDSHNLTALLGLGLAGLAASFGLARKRED